MKRRKLHKISKFVFIRRVEGQSMYPALRQGQVVVCSSLHGLRKNRVVIIRHDDKEKVKRLDSIKDEKITVVGDNQDQSTDSRDFGKLEKRQIIGVVIYPRV